MDRIAQEVWDMAFGRMEGYPGNYTSYTRLRAERMERRRIEYEAQQQSIAATEDFVRRYMAGQRTKEAQGRAKRLARLERLQRPQEARSIHLRLTTHYRGGDHVLEAAHVTIGYGRHALFSGSDLLIQRGERVALIGPNGCGKSTFLKTVLGETPPLAGDVRVGANIHLAYYSQTHEGLNPQATVLDEILAYDPVIERARGFLGRFLFTGDDVYKQISQLSGGERSRVALAKLTMENANFLLLDEPTNHLDILSQEVLEDVLTDFPGTILFVSHDRYLIDALATHVWAVEGDRIVAYEGNYSDYLEEKALRAQRSADALKRDDIRHAEKAKREQRGTAVPAQRTSRQERERQTQLAELETQISALEEKLAALNEEMTVAGQKDNGQRVWAISRDYQSAEEALARAFAEWERIAG
jgi:ATP-binding cassette subfamily F protein 3